MAPSDRTRQWAQNGTQRFPLSIRKQFFTVRVKKVARQVVESPSLEIFKSCMDMAQGNWL